MERPSLSFRVTEAVEAWLRRHAPPSVVRLAYRVGYLVLRPLWMVSRPRTNGVKAVVRRGDQVLLVRHAYARRDVWDLPGGFLRPGEEPLPALRRELAEELGLEAGPMVAIAATPARTDGKREILFTVRVEVDGAEVRPDPAEIAHVCWAPRDALPEGTSRFARRMVARAYWEVWDAEAPEAVARP